MKFFRGIIKKSCDIKEAAAVEKGYDNLIKTNFRFMRIFLRTKIFI